MFENFLRKKRRIKSAQTSFDNLYQFFIDLKKEIVEYLILQENYWVLDVDLSCPPSPAPAASKYRKIIGVKDVRIQLMTVGNFTEMEQIIRCLVKYFSLVMIHDM